MYEVLGLKTRKTYASGSKAECFRLLNKQYPTLEYDKRPKGRANARLYPEPLKIYRRGSYDAFTKIETQSVRY